MKWWIILLSIIVIYLISAYTYHKKTNKNLFDSIIGLFIKVKWTGEQIDELKKWLLTNNIDSSSMIECIIPIITRSFTYNEFQDIIREGEELSQNNNPPSDLLTNFMSIVISSNCESK